MKLPFRDFSSTVLKSKPIPKSSMKLLNKLYLQIHAITYEITNFNCKSAKCIMSINKPVVCASLVQILEMFYFEY
jgi:hypothetical protein